MIKNITCRLKNLLSKLIHKIKQKEKLKENTLFFILSKVSMKRNSVLNNEQGYVNLLK